MNYSSLSKGIFLGVLLTFSTQAFAEYYIVYPKPSPKRTCYERVIVKPVIKKRHHYVKKRVHKRIKHHYVKARPCSSCQVSVYYNYPSCPLHVNNLNASCSCRGACYDEYDISMDRRTADDVTSELQLD